MNSLPKNICYTTIKQHLVRRAALCLAITFIYTLNIYDSRIIITYNQNNNTFK